MLVHRVTGDAAPAPSAQHVSRRDDLRFSAGIERHAQTVRIIFDRCHAAAEFDLQPLALEVIAQNAFGAPLRKAALKFKWAAGSGEVDGRDLLQARTEELNLPDAYPARKNGWISPLRRRISKIAGCRAVPRVS